ncbi:MAG: hypothetical protein ACK44H_06480, partial [Candidatus Kryptonium sp.]
MKPPNSSNNLSKYEQSFADFACDYSIKARVIASISLALTFISLNFILKLSLPIHVFIIAALFQSLINQPYRFLRNLLKSSDKALFITNIIDIIVISIVVYYAG